MKADALALIHVMGSIGLVAVNRGSIVTGWNADRCGDEGGKASIGLLFAFKARLLELRTFRARPAIWIVVAALLVAILKRTVGTRPAFRTLALRLTILLTVEATILHEWLRLGSRGKGLWLVLEGLRRRIVLLLLER